MRHPLPALVVVLVVAASISVGTPVTPVGSSDDAASQGQAALPMAEPTNTTKYLSVGGDQTSRFGTATLDVGTAVGIESSRLNARFATRTYRRSFGAAGTTGARRAVLDDATADLQARMASLDERYRRTIQRYEAGEISTTTAVGSLAEIDARARELQAGTERLSRQVYRNLGYQLPSRTHATAVLLQGPVRNSVAGAIRGQSPPVTVYAASTDGGIVLARTASNRYVREAFLAEPYDPDGERQIGLNGALQRAESIYGWAANNSVTSGSVDSYGTFYRYVIDHSQGRLTTFIDASSTDVFREVQRKRLGSVPIADSRLATNATAELTVRANLTHGTGPMQVTVRDATTNATVDATVTVEGQSVGRTGPDGRLWTVQPQGSATLTAGTDAGNVTLQLPAGA